MDFAPTPKFGSALAPPPLPSLGGALTGASADGGALGDVLDAAPLEQAASTRAMAMRPAIAGPAGRRAFMPPETMVDPGWFREDRTTTGAA
jgi:hypothetical protein